MYNNIKKRQKEKVFSEEPEACSFWLDAKLVNLTVGSKYEEIYNLSIHII